METLVMALAGVIYGVMVGHALLTRDRINRDGCSGPECPDNS